MLKSTPLHRRHPERAQRVEGPPYFAFVVAFGLVLASTLTSKAQVLQRPNLRVLHDIKTHRCDADETKLFTSREASSLLSVYGYPNHVAWMCEATSVSWLPTARIIQLHGVTAEVDSNRTVTFARAGAGERLWLIPAINGMVTYADIWDDPHNSAVLNDLLRVSSYSPKSPEEWTELGLLYLYMTGWQIHIDSYSRFGEQRLGLKSSEVQLRKLKLLPSVEHNKQGIDITVNELAADGNYFAWEFYFASTDGPVLLTSATREQHKVGEPKN